MLYCLGYSTIIPDEKGYRSTIYYSLFPFKVVKGKSAEGFKWILDRITDGNGVATPRDLISVLEASKTLQLEQIQREGESALETIISEESLRKAVIKISKENLTTRIYAEYPDLRSSVEKFRRGKADHNLSTLTEKLGAQVDELLPRLERIGVIYQRNRKGVEMWTFPFLFSYALDITRGAAFSLPSGTSDEEDD